MTVLAPQKLRLPRRWLFLAIFVAIAAVLYFLLGPDSQSKSVERRVERWLNAARRQELRNAAPFWIQRALWTIASRFPSDSNADIRAELLALGPRAIPALSKALLNDPSPSVRAAAANILGQLGEPEAFQALTNSLRVDLNERVMPAVAEALVELGDSNAVPALISALAIQTNDFIRAGLLGSLARFHDPLAVQTLTAALAHETNEVLRSAAAQGLGEIGARSAWTNLIEVLCADRSVSARVAAASALGRLDMPESVPALLWQMRTNLTSDVRQAVISALPINDDAEVLAALSAALTQEKDARVRECVVWKLGAMTNEAARFALRLAATNDPSASVSKYAVNELASSISQRPLAELPRIVREDSFEEVREAAALALVETGRPEAVAALTNFLQNSPSPPLRGSVLEAMSAKAMPQVFPFLLERLKMDLPARLEAATALGLLGDAKAIGPLMTALTNDPAVEMRCSAAAALGNLHAAAAIPLLINLVQHETNSPLRSVCISALGAARDRRAVPPLVQCATQKRDAALRHEACRALGEIGDSAAVGILAEIAAHERLQYLRLVAIQSLGQLGSADAVASLLSNLSRWGRNAQERVALLKACEATGDLAVVPPLAKMLDNDDERVVLAAAEALGNLGATNAVSGLLRVATAGSRAVRAQAAKALGQIGDSRALPVLAEMLARDRYSKARVKAAESLGIISDTNAIPALKSALSDPDDEVRTEVICSLGHLGDTNCAAFIIALLKDKQRPTNVRFDVCYFLVEMGGPPGVDALTEMLADGDMDVRLAAGCALAALGQTNALESARSFIEHPNPFCRLAAIVCLASSKTPETAHILKQKAVSESDPLAHFAATALSDGFPPLLPTALEDNDVKIRRAAVFLALFFNEPAALPALRKACADRDPEIRDGARWTARRLARLNHTSPHQNLNP